MRLLVTQSDVQMREHAHPLLGRLVTPRHYPTLEQIDGPWAADNDCFQGLDMLAYDRMLTALLERAPVGDCLFVTVPDVWSDARATAEQWVRWQSAPRRRGLPLAFVAQDGCERGLTPMLHEFDCLFIGGTDEWRLSLTVERLVKAAKRAGKWVHFGRVNTYGRRAYAHRIGCDSIDGTSYVKWRDAHLDRGLEHLVALDAAPVQERMAL